jgi:hypothetical protein
MSRTPAISCVYDEGVFKPLPESAAMVRRHYEQGERVKLAPPPAERSDIEHGFYFAVVEAAWMNLGPELAERYKTAKALRKQMLLKAGFFDEKIILCEDREQAERTAVIAETLNPDAIVKIVGDTVVQWSAESQSYEAMGRGRFRRSKRAVLEELAEMLGVTVDQLTKTTRNAA